MRLNRRRIVAAMGGKKTFYDNFNRSNGAIGNPWTGATWTISSNAAVNTPTEGDDKIVNGGFGADSDWSKGTDWSIGAGVATKAAGAVASNLSQTVAPLTVGAWYAATWDIVRTGGSFQMFIGTYASVLRSLTGSYIDKGRAPATSFTIRAVTGSTAGNVDNIVCKPLTLATLLCTVLYTRPFATASVGITFDAASAVQGGLILNLDDTATPANLILVYCNRGDNKIYVDECVAGTYTNKASTAYTYSAGAALAATKTSATSVSVTYGGAAVGTATTVTSNLNKRFGLFSTGSPTQAQFDNFSLLPA